MEIQQIPLYLVYPSPMNPRKTFDEGELQELADNIEKQGLLQPITVRPVKDAKQFAVVNGNADFHPKYEIICGERRFRAFCKLSDKWREMNCVAPKGQTYDRFSEITAIVREMNDEEAFDAMITENLQRKDVDPIEEAFAFGQLIQKGKTAEEVAARFGKSVRFVQDRVKLNKLIPELMLAVKDEKMPIVAAMTISKLDEDIQRKYHSSYSNNSKGFDKASAESFVNSLFMSIDKAPWYQTDDQQDEDYEGGCGIKCSECQLNTANHGCLFWSMKTEDAGKCTDRNKFYSKHTAFILDFLNNYKKSIIQKGSHLESGKVVIIDEDEWCSLSTKELKKSLYESIRAAGYEVVKCNELFEGKCYYSESDKRLKKNIEMGNVYECLKIFSYDNVSLETQWHYFKGKSKMDETSSKEPSTATQSVDAMKLIQKRNRIREIAIENLTAKSREMANNLGEAKRKGELSDAELFAFQIIIFTLCGNKMLERYGHKGCGKPSDRSFIDVVRQNRADWPIWIREFIRNIISSADITYNGLYKYCSSEVLKEWMPKEFKAIVTSINDKLSKDLAKNAEKLKELGYGTDGKLLPTPKKDYLAKPEPTSLKIPLGKTVRQQYKEMKAKHPDAVILFRVGDFYECFNEDAEKVAKSLNITLTSTKEGKLAGFPHHAFDTYLPKLVRAGIRVAICEKLQDPKNDKKKEKKKDSDFPTMEFVEKKREVFPNSLLLFHVGEYYECYDQDAEDLDMDGGSTFNSETKWGQEILVNRFHQNDLDKVFVKLNEADLDPQIIEDPE